MRLGELSAAELRSRLKHRGLAVHTGPLICRIRSSFETVAQGLERLYPDYALADPDAFCDFDCELAVPRGLRSWYKPQAVFRFDGAQPFHPMAAHQAFAMLEWGLNWCVSAHCHQYLIIHAAVIARDGHAAILPAPPGSGKSTLCAALVSRGWRLLSDELALIDMTSGSLQPLPRPVSLKNRSIEVIQQFAPSAVIGPVTLDTAKGTVAHMRAPRASVEQADRPAQLRWLIFPRYEAGAATASAPVHRGEALIALAENAFNYHLQGTAGFERLSTELEQAQCMSFRYSRLDEAIAFFDQLKA